MRRPSLARLALLSAVVVGALAASGSSGATRQTSPACSSTNLATWSPDGTQIAFVGRRLHHGMLPVRAICVANANGKQATPLPHTVCTRRCRLDLIDSPSQLVWVQPNLLLYGDDYRIFTIPIGGTPQPLGKQPGTFSQFSVDSAGDRVATGGDPSCVQCKGPVTVLSVPSGALVGRLGGKKVNNVEASISPDGSKVVFARFTSGDSSRPLGVWTASASGSNLRRIVAKGSLPLWSPTGTTIAYLAKPRISGSTLRLVPSAGGKSRTLLSGIWAEYGWSPDGTQIAVEIGRGQRLAVVNVATGKVRNLLRLHFASTVDWSADSQELLVKTQPRRTNRCADLYRVPARGGKPQLLRRC